MFPVGGRRERCLVLVGALPSGEKILVPTIKRPTFGAKAISSIGFER